MKPLMGTSKKQVVVGFTCWELNSHQFKALVLPTFTYGTKILEVDLKNSYWKVFEKGTKMHKTSNVKVRSLTPIIFGWLNLENFP